MLSLVPGRFEAYVRVFHTFRLGFLPVRWHEVAAALGRRAHAPGLEALPIDPASAIDDRSDALGPLPGGD